MGQSFLWHGTEIRTRSHMIQIHNLLLASVVSESLSSLASVTSELLCPLSLTHTQMQQFHTCLQPALSVFLYAMFSPTLSLIFITFWGSPFPSKHGLAFRSLNWGLVCTIIIIIDPVHWHWSMLCIYFYGRFILYLSFQFPGFFFPDIPIFIIDKSACCWTRERVSRIGYWWKKDTYSIERVVFPRRDIL